MKTIEINILLLQEELFFYIFKVDFTSYHNNS